MHALVAPESLDGVDRVYALLSRWIKPLACHWPLVWLAVVTPSAVAELPDPRASFVGFLLRTLRTPGLTVTPETLPLECQMLLQDATAAFSGGLLRHPAHMTVVGGHRRKSHPPLQPPPAAASTGASTTQATWAMQALWAWFLTIACPFVGGYIANRLDDQQANWHIWLHRCRDLACHSTSGCPLRQLTDGFPAPPLIQDHGTPTGSATAESALPGVPIFSGPPALLPTQRHGGTWANASAMGAHARQRHPLNGLLPSLLARVYGFAKDLAKAWVHRTIPANPNAVLALLQSDAVARGSRAVQAVAALVVASAWKAVGCIEVRSLPLHAVRAQKAQVAAGNVRGFDTHGLWLCPVCRALRSTVDNAHVVGFIDVRVDALSGVRYCGRKSGRTLELCNKTPLVMLPLLGNAWWVLHRWFFACGRCLLVQSGRCLPPDGVYVCNACRLETSSTGTGHSAEAVPAPAATAASKTVP